MLKWLINFLKINWKEVLVTFEGTTFYKAKNELTYHGIKHKSKIKSFTSGSSYSQTPRIYSLLVSPNNEHKAHELIRKYK